MLALLWILAALFVFWVACPSLLAVLGCTKSGASSVADPTRVTVDNWNDGQQTHIHEQLSMLGMTPLGIVNEEIWFLAPHWFKRFELRVFGCDEQSCFACIYRLFPNEPMRVALATCFEDGGLVWTGNHMADFKKVEDKYVRWGVKTTDMAELLGNHHKVVDAMRTAGHKTARHDDVGILANTVAGASAKHLPPRSARMALLSVSLAAPVFAFTWARTNYGLDHAMVPVAVLLGCIGWLVFFHVLFLNSDTCRNGIDQVPSHA